MVINSVVGVTLQAFVQISIHRPYQKFSHLSCFYVNPLHFLIYGNHPIHHQKMKGDTEARPSSGYWRTTSVVWQAKSQCSSTRTRRSPTMPVRPTSSAWWSTYMFPEVTHHMLEKKIVAEKERQKAEAPKVSILSQTAPRPSPSVEDVLKDEDLVEAFQH